MSDTPVQELALEASHDKAGFSFLLARINWKRTFFIVLGVVLFTIVYYSPPWPDAVDPMGEHFPLSKEAKGALAVFLLAGIWWVFEVVPIGVTSITIGVMQSMFLIRTASQAFKDFMDPSVWFIFGSIVIGMVFTKTGLTRRLAYKMLSIVGEKTSMIYLGCFLVTAALTHVMAHTAVAATVYPLLLTIYSLYGEGERPTKFGKGLFMGMAYVAGAGSIVTLLGAARGAVAIGFFKGIVGREVTFFELTYYMFPIRLDYGVRALGFLYDLFQTREEDHSRPAREGKDFTGSNGWHHRQGGFDYSNRRGGNHFSVAAIFHSGPETFQQVRGHPHCHHPLLSHQDSRP